MNASPVVFLATLLLAPPVLAASTTDFIRVRMRVGTVAAPATGGGE